MHMRDLSKDDDFLSHLLVEKLGTGTVPLLVHKMDSSRRLPKTDTEDLMKIVRRLVASKGPVQQVVRHAVDDLLILPAIRYYLKSYTQKQINAFATHASRYFELYHPSGCIEIAHTSRYSHHTGKSELCILATRNLAPGSVVTELKGSMANLTEEEDKELKRTDLRNSDIRRDFSVIHSKSMKKNHLFLGPARFVNHDCDNNCELFREGRYITFRVLRPIAIGEEITAHYGDGYFGKKNKHCLCETCEKNGRGGYAPNRDDPESSDSSSSSDSDSDSDSDSSSSSSSESDAEKPVLNLHERRTRRGVYAVAKPSEDSSDDSDMDEDDDKMPLMAAPDVPRQSEMALSANLDTGSELTSLAASLPPSDVSSPPNLPTPGAMTPDRGRVSSRSSSSLTELTSSTPKSSDSTPFRSIISTRRQKQSTAGSSKGATSAKEISRCTSLESPRRLTRSISSLRLSEKSKGKGKASLTPVATPASARQSKGAGKEEPKIKKEEGEARVLRVRPPTATVEVTKEPPPKPEVRRGPDGKPLPQCSTCSNVLPLIAVDQKVVWGLTAETGKKKKNVKQECPRCIRHFAIYQQSWPRRTAPHGFILATPREDSVPIETITKKVTHQGLKMLDHKLAAAAASVSAGKLGKKRQHVEEDEDEGAPAMKRRKSLPEPVLHKAKVIRTYSSNSRRRRASPSPEPPKKRGPGRPRLTSPRYRPKVRPEEQQAQAEKAALEQPRSVNGRFGKKDKVPGENDESPQEEDGRRISPRRKRNNEDLEQLDDSPRKALKRPAQDEVEALAPIRKFLPHPTSSFRGGGLVSNPNPLKYARYAWSGNGVPPSSSSSSEDEKHPETPEDGHSATADIVDPDELSLFAPRPPIVPRGPLTYRPSPQAFAKNRWNVPTITKPTLTHKLALPSLLNHRRYLSDGESSDMTSLDHDIVHSPPADDYPSDDESLPTKLRHTYPVLPVTATSIPCIPKGTKFLSANSETKPNFINAGWDDASDASEA